jgi:hypothetical protein
MYTAFCGLKVCCTLQHGRKVVENIENMKKALYIHHSALYNMKEKSWRI